eukprot:scaffold1392_cov135-Pinguiococcus_pyrenoidosus.AAC.1
MDNGLPGDPCEVNLRVAHEATPPDFGSRAESENLNLGQMDRGPRGFSRILWYPPIPFLYSQLTRLKDLGALQVSRYSADST